MQMIKSKRSKVCDGRLLADKWSLEPNFIASCEAFQNCNDVVRPVPPVDLDAELVTEISADATGG